MIHEVNQLIPDYAKNKPKIILENRGTCSAVTKVKHAQNAGAIASVIIDNVIEDITSIAMADNGDGS